MEKMQDIKMKGFSTGLYHLVRILRGFSFAGVIISVVFFGLVLILGEKMIVPGTAGEADLFSITLELTDEATPSFARVKPILLMQLAFGGLVSGLLWFIFQTLVKVTREARAGRPFSEQMPAALRNLGIAVIAYGVLDAVLTQVYLQLISSAYRLSTLWKPELVKGVSVDSPTEVLPWIVAGLLLFFLSYVFRYGMKLQQESDETL